MSAALSHKSPLNSPCDSFILGEGFLQEKHWTGYLGLTETLELPAECLAPVTVLVLTLVGCVSSGTLLAYCTMNISPSVGKMKAHMWAAQHSAQNKMVLSEDQRLGLLLC